MLFDTHLNIFSSLPAMWLGVDIRYQNSVEGVDATANEEHGKETRGLVTGTDDYGISDDH
jgi:hypothetical protein